MKKAILFFTFIISAKLNFAQLKYFLEPNPSIEFIIKTNNLSISDSENALLSLRQNTLNSNFTFIDSVTIKFKHELVGYPNLNIVENALQANVNEFGAKVKFHNLEQSKEILNLSRVGIIDEFVADLSSVQSEEELENFMLGERKFLLVNANSETHRVFIIYDLELGEDLVIDILKSKGKVIIKQEEFKKYY